MIRTTKPGAPRTPARIDFFKPERQLYIEQLVADLSIKIRALERLDTRDNDELNRRHAEMVAARTAVVAAFLEQCP